MRYATLAADDGIVEEEAVTDGASGGDTAVMTNDATNAPERTAPAHRADEDTSARFRWDGPLPHRTRRSIGAGIVVALAIALLLEVVVLRGDWAAGALAMGIAAVWLALLSIVVWMVRWSRGRRARSTTIASLALAAILLLVGTAGTLGVNPLHLAQARQLEGSGQWAGAIREYAQTGERSPNAPDIARVYDEWGEAQLSRHDYAGAAASFTTVLEHFPTTSGGSVARANRDLYATYSGWIPTGATTLNFPLALNFLTSYAQQSCNAACQQQTTMLLAQAYYEFGEQLAAQKRYADAITQFQTVQASYAQSAFATQAHSAAASAYYTYGQQWLTSVCANALPLYQTLARNYADTPEGKLARQALVAPQSVTGTLTGYPTNPAPSLHLSKSINASIFVFSDDYSATLDSQTGAFTFSRVALGNYNLSAARPNGNGAVQFDIFHDAKGNAYTVHVGPLCPLNLGTLAY